VVTAIQSVQDMERGKAERVFAKGVAYTEEELEFRHQQQHVTTCCI